MNEHPKYLFHYTSKENLCLILRKKTIRFSRLDQVNDPEEALTKHFSDACLFTYVSCWTSEEEESLPMWKMYSADMRGLRIQLPVNMFKGRRNPEYESTGFPIMHIDANLNIKRKSCNYPALLVGPSKVEYMKEPLNTNSCFYENNDQTIDVELLHLGLSKHKYWAFEKEWRFKIIGMPFEGRWPKDHYTKFFEVPLNKYIDVPLDKSVFSELIIQLGPKASFADAEIVRLLLKEYAPGAKLCDSSCKIRL